MKLKSSRVENLAGLVITGPKAYACLAVNVSLVRDGCTRTLPKQHSRNSEKGQQDAGRACCPAGVPLSYSSYEPGNWHEQWLYQAIQP